MFYGAGVLLETYWSMQMDDAMAALFAIMFSAFQAGNAAAFGPDMGKAKVAAERVFRIIDYPSRIDARASEEKGLKINPLQFLGKIEFKDVWFRYPRRTEDFVLRGLNLTINPKESVALVGESGCGKSTFVNLVMRFYDVDSGDVFVDGVNIKDYDLHSLREHISMVMQEPIIFNYNILENVLYGKPNASNSEVKKACEDSNCMEFIENHGGENKEELAFDDSAQALLKEMAQNKDKVVALIG
jgi:ABC-type multidrug transport system fused ATPase/permease subunit